MAKTGLQCSLLFTLLMLMCNHAASTESDFNNEEKVNDFNKKYLNYLEEKFHLLYHWYTPVFIAEVKSSVHNDSGPNIVYNQVRKQKILKIVLLFKFILTKNILIE